MKCEHKTFLFIECSVYEFLAASAIDKQINLVCALRLWHILESFNIYTFDATEYFRSTVTYCFPFFFDAVATFKFRYDIHTHTFIVTFSNLFNELLPTLHCNMVIVDD